MKKDLISCLRHANKKRKANGEPKKDSILQEIKTIHECPQEVEERKIPRHWEADLIKGKDNKSAIATLIERNTRLCILAVLPDAKAESVRLALTEALKYLPDALRKTLTYDRGREMAEHKILEQDLGMDVYFCDPHSPWQKGTSDLIQIILICLIQVIDPTRPPNKSTTSDTLHHFRLGLDEHKAKLAVLDDQRLNAKDDLSLS